MHGKIITKQIHLNRTVRGKIDGRKTVLKDEIVIRNVTVRVYGDGTLMCFSPLGSCTLQTLHLVLHVLVFLCVTFGSCRGYLNITSFKNFKSHSASVCKEQFLVLF